MLQVLHSILLSVGNVPQVTMLVSTQLQPALSLRDKWLMTREHATFIKKAARQLQRPPCDQRLRRKNLGQSRPQSQPSRRHSLRLESATVSDWQRMGPPVAANGAQSLANAASRPRGSSCWDAQRCYTDCLLTCLSKLIGKAVPFAPRHAAQVTQLSTSQAMRGR
jgi:hypothetical protein